MSRPRVLIEEWLPAAAIGVECIRERSTGQQPPDKRLHVWWARRPLTAARAAVLGSVLPADFPRETFEKLLGFWGSAAQIAAAQEYLDRARAAGIKVPNMRGPPVIAAAGCLCRSRGLRSTCRFARHQAVWRCSDRP